MNSSSDSTLNWSLYADPPDSYDLYRRLRDEAPVFLTERHGQYVLSRYADVVNTVLDHRTFSSRMTAFPEPQHLPVINMDPPKHDELRAIISRPFLPREVAKLENTIRDLVTRRLDDLASKGAGNFVTDFAELIPSDVIGGILGVAEADRPRLGRLATVFLSRDPGEIAAPPRSVEAIQELRQYFIGLRQDLDSAPRDDLMSMLKATKVRGARFSDHDFASMCSMVAIAGYETTTHLIIHAAVELFRHPEQRAWLVQHPERIPDAVREVLRFRTPVPILGRMATRDVELHGVTILRGAPLILILASAARDERHYRDPDRFDIRREEGETIAFGQGRHTCFGAPLARLEVRVVLEELLRRFPDYEIDESSIVPMAAAETFGYEQVTIRLGSRPSA